MQKKNRSISEGIAGDLKEGLAGRSEKYVLTECAACGMQIEKISEKVSVHPLKVLGQAYGL